MSVPVGQRGKSKLDAHTKTEELVLHTLTIGDDAHLIRRMARARGQG